MIKVIIMCVDGTDRWFPVPHCDQCERRIVDVTNANYLWNPETESAPVFLHKYCCNEFESARPDIHYYWAPLREFSTAFYDSFGC